VTRVVLDKDTLTKLFNLSKPLEVCDESGSTLGYFHPAVDQSLYRHIEIPTSEEELQARERELGGRFLEEILHDLERSK
jgi:hypothetical protein